MITLDFETEAIDGNPLIAPPTPVGLSIKHNDDPSVYITDPQEMYNAWSQTLESGEPMLFQNAPFDLSVAEKAFGFPFPDWQRIHDTQYQIFLENPYAKSLSLKPAAERILGLPPEEQPLF